MTRLTFMGGDHGREPRKQLLLGSVVFEEAAVGRHAGVLQLQQLEVVTQHVV